MTMLDEAGRALTVLERLKIDAEIMKLVRERMALKPGVPLYAVKMAKVAARIVVLLRQRGVDLDAPARERAAFVPDGPPDTPAEPRAATSQFYAFDPNRKHSERKKDNAAAMALLRQINAGEINGAELTDEQKGVLAKYSGTGGNLEGADGLKGSAYEYYTPQPVAEGMWDMLKELGFKGGKVLDPCAGVGVFGATAPANAAIEAVELNETSGRINQLVNGGPSYNAIVSPFEAIASRTDDEIYDAVITNVPFGGIHDRGANRKIDPKYQDQPLEFYFIMRSLEKLRPGGLAAFITPPRVVSGKGGKEESLRTSASLIAEFLGAYRLPNSVFGTADADTITDVIVFRKFGRDAAEKIRELREQNPVLLSEANVLWPEFTGGDYFRGEGRRFVLGEFKAKDPSKFRDVDRVISDQSVGNIAKLLRKFPGSRIDWKAINAAESEPILYNEGDTVVLAGQTLEFRGGALVPVEKADNTTQFDGLFRDLATPLSAVSAAVNWEQADSFVAHYRARSLDLDIPAWLSMASADVTRVPAGDRHSMWKALISGLAAIDVMQRHAGQAAFNYHAEYPMLSDAIEASVSVKAPASFSRPSKMAFAKARVIYDRKAGFSVVWKGEGEAEVAIGDLDAEGKIGAMQYQSGAALTIEGLKEAYGDDFDVHASDEWCLGADGKTALRADDYYTGNLGDFMARLDAEIKAAEEPLRSKLQRQREMARERVDTIDTESIRFNLFTPFVTMEEKCEFLRRFVDPAFNTAINNNGAPYIVYEGPSGKNANERQALMSRLATYLTGDAGGSGVRSMSLQGKKLGIKDRDKALTMLRKIAQQAHTEFDGWAKANPVIGDRLKATANDPSRIYFREVDDGAPLAIPGMNPDLKLHGYQNAYVRKQARSFGGINGFEVGLGKSFTALAAAQYVHSIGVKKKTLFVVPNSVLSNWRRETSRAYASMDDCLFIGLDVDEKTGKASVDPANYARDFMRILENRHRKIFCSIEAFGAIPLKDATLTEYESYIMGVDDPSYAGSEKKAESQRAESRRADLLGGAKSSAYPYFEDMGIDSLVIDEAHCFPAGTMVDGVPIESIKIGDMVRAVDVRTGAVVRRSVTDVMSRVPPALVRVHFSDGRSIACTPDHPFYTGGGEYTEAALLSNSSLVVFDRGWNHGKTSGSADSAQLLGVRQGVHAEQCAVVEDENGQGDELLLFPSLCISGALRQAGIPGGVQRGKCTGQEGCVSCGSDAGAGHDVMPGVWQGLLPNEVSTLGSSLREECSLSLLGALPREVGDLAPGAAGTDAGGSEIAAGGARLSQHAGGYSEAIEDPARRGGDRGVWSSCARAAATTGGRSWMADGVSGCDPAGAERRLQGGVPRRYCEPGVYGGNRGGREIAQVWTDASARCEEGYGLALVGVDRVEILERGSDGRFGGVCPDGLVYDITVDEHHNFFAEGALVHNCYKNSKNVLEFSGGKFLSVAKASQRGMDMQVKTWYVRGLTPANDGVLAMSASIVTNSPLEIYGALTLAVGEKKVHDLCLGVRGADEFMNTMCIIEDDEDVGIDGTVKPYRVFRGLQNVGLLRNALGAIATIKTAKDVAAAGDNLNLPDAPETAEPVDLPKETLVRLNDYKMAYRAAKEVAGMASKDADPATEEEFAALERVQAKSGEDVALIAHPFNLIQKMANLIADPELDERATFYVVSPSQRAEAEAAIDAFNKLKRIEEKPRSGPWTKPEAIVGETIVSDGDDTATVLKIRVEAGFTPDGRIYVDTMDYKLQGQFEAAAKKAKLELDCTVPPKLAAMLENVKTEESKPRSKSGRVKQIIFCDVLPMHNKIKRILTTKAGISESAIRIISGAAIKDAEQMQDIQDGFNADGEENKYRSIIANKKGEVGINLQKGTQAIHHLTIGWTPDSQHQRNGRGVRQGNTTGYVNIYHYDADGTFDGYKRRLTNAKADWIGAVMDVNGGNEVVVSGGLDAQQYDDMIESMGNAGAIASIEERARLREQMARADSSRQRQVINLQTAHSMGKFAADHAEYGQWLARQAGIIFDLRETVRKMEDRSLGKMKPLTLVKFQNKLAEMQASLAGMIGDMDESATWNVSGGGMLFSAKLKGGGYCGYYSVKSKIKEDLVRFARYSFGAPVEGSAMMADWQSEVSQAQAMARASLKEFARIGRDDAGAYSDRMADVFAAGGGTFLDGAPLCKGMFIRVADGDLMVIDGSLMANRQGQRALALSDAIRGGTVIGFNHPEYTDALREAAAADDAKAAKPMSEYETAGLFSEMNPDVAEHRKVVTRLRVLRSSYNLMAPHFPYPVPDVHADKASETLRSIVRAQSAIIKGWEGVGGMSMIVESTDGLKKVAYGSAEKSPSTMANALIARAKDAGAKLSLYDINIMTAGSGQAIDPRAYAVWPADARARYSAASSVEDVEAIDSALIDETFRWVELGGLNSIEYLTAFAGGLSMERRSAMLRINPPEPPPFEPTIAAVDTSATAPAGGVTQVGGVAVSRGGKIGLTGQTLARINAGGKSLAVKDAIKQSAIDIGQRATWQLKKEQWDVTPEAYAKFCADYPEAARKVSIVPALA